MSKTKNNEIDELVASIVLKGLGSGEQNNDEFEKNIGLISKYMFDFNYKIDFENKAIIIHFEDNLKERIFNELNYDTEYNVQSLEELCIPLDVQLKLENKDFLLLINNIFTAYSYCSTEFIKNIYDFSKYTTNFLDLSASIRVIKDIFVAIEMYYKSPREKGIIVIKNVGKNFVEIDIKYLKDYNKLFIDMTNAHNIIYTDHLIFTENILSSLLRYNKCTEYKYEINMNLLLKLITAQFDILSILDRNENNDLDNNFIN